MLTHQRKPVSFSLVSLDLALESCVDTSATFYQRERDRYHILLTEPIVQGIDPLPTEPLPMTWSSDSPSSSPTAFPSAAASQRFLWLEVSPYRAILTVQGNGRLHYRHLWERGVYGLSRYWLQDGESGQQGQLRLRNFTRELSVKGSPLPEWIHLEYELWSEQVPLGRYALNLEIHH